MDSLATNEDPDDIFHQGLHCLQRQNRSAEKEKQYFGESTICVPSI